MCKNYEKDYIQLRQRPTTGYILYRKQPNPLVQVHMRLVLRNNPRFSFKIETVKLAIVKWLLWIGKKCKSIGSKRFQNA